MMHQPEKILFTWSSMFGNNYFSEGYDYGFGSNGTLIHDEFDRAVFLPQEQEAGAAAAPPIGKGKDRILP